MSAATPLHLRTRNRLTTNYPVVKLGANKDGASAILRSRSSTKPARFVFARFLLALPVTALGDTRVIGVPALRCKGHRFLWVFNRVGDGAAGIEGGIAYRFGLGCVGTHFGRKESVLVKADGVIVRGIAITPSHACLLTTLIAVTIVHTSLCVNGGTTVDLVLPSALTL